MVAEASTEFVERQLFCFGPSEVIESHLISILLRRNTSIEAINREIDVHSMAGLISKGNEDNRNSIIPYENRYYYVELGHILWVVYFFMIPGWLGAFSVCFFEIVSQSKVRNFRVFRQICIWIEMFTDGKRYWYFRKNNA